MVYSGNDWKNVKEPVATPQTWRDALHDINIRYAIGDMDRDTWSRKYDALMAPETPLHT